MLSGSAILRVSLLLVLAGCLAALVQYVLPRGAPEPEPAATVTAASKPRRVETQPAPPSPPQPAPDPPRALETGPVPAPVPSPQPAAEVPAPAAPRPRPAAPVAPSLPQRAPPVGETAVDEASDNAGPRALALVDLNSASLAQLNGLRGGGSIGRAIIQRRPYTAIDQLLSKRVLSRAIYDKIKDQVTVR